MGWFTSRHGSEGYRLIPKNTNQYTENVGARLDPVARIAYEALCREWELAVLTRRGQGSDKLRIEKALVDLCRGAGGFTDPERTARDVMDAIEMRINARNENHTDLY